jgi:hypothetical protein
MSVKYWFNGKWQAKTEVFWGKLAPAVLGSYKYPQSLLWD